MPKQRVVRHAVTQPLDESYRLIPLTCNQTTVVDAADFEWLSQWNWRAQWNKRGKTFYAVRSQSIGNQRTKNIYMHRQILGCCETEGDHKNRDTLDNRRQNLRECTSSQNKINGSLRKTNSTGFRGVSLYKKTGKFAASIWVNKAKTFLGYFTTSENAARAYDEAAKKFHGDFAVLNFP